MLTRCVHPPDVTLPSRTREQLSETTSLDDAFSTARQPIILLLVTIMVVQMMLTVTAPSFRVAYGVCFVGSGVLLACRAWLGRIDETRGRLLFGRAMVVVSPVSHAALLAYLREHPLEDLVHAITANAAAVIFFLMVVYLHFSAVAVEHRRLYVASSMVGMCLMPQWSTLGRPLEPLVICVGLICGEFLGGSLARRIRLAPSSLSDRLAEPPPVNTSGVPGMHPWSLTFEDTAQEARYTEEAFRTSCTPSVALKAHCMLANLLLTLVHPSANVPGFAGCFCCAAMLLPVRLLLARCLDQQAALRTYGLAVNAAFAVCFSATILWVNYEPPAEQSRPEVVAVCAILWGIVPVHNRLCAMRAAHRLAWLATAMAGFVALPQWSTLGRASEAVCVCGALLLGELVGYTLELYWRKAVHSLHTRDVQRKLVEDEAERLKCLARAKDNFVASLSHEMRTPLNGVLGLLQCAQRCQDLASVHHYIERALGAGSVLTGLLDDTLDVTRIEQGHEAFNPCRFSLPTLADGCLDLVRPAATAKSIAIELHVDPAVAAAGECIADARRLQQVIINLMSNAIKFTPYGKSVKLHLERRTAPGTDGGTAGCTAADDIEGSPYLVSGGEPTGAGESTPHRAAPPAASTAGTLPLLLSVSDEGLGIHPDDRELIFLKYTKAKDARGGDGVDRHAGAGLGLSICKAIVERHSSGQITVESTLGQGSTFRVRLDLPLAPPTADAAPDTAGADTPERSSLAGLSVLVVDDVALNRQVASEMLRLLGCATAEACDGLAAVSTFRERHAAGEPFDAVLMDVQMPRMNGTEAASRIRAHEASSGSVEASEPGERVPIIALTGFAGAEERDRCLASGMDDYMTKPLSLNEAAHKLSVHVQRPRRSTTPVVSGSSDESHGEGPTEADSVDSTATTTAPTPEVLRAAPTGSPPPQQLRRQRRAVALSDEDKLVAPSDDGELRDRSASLTELPPTPLARSASAATASAATASAVGPVATHSGEPLAARLGFAPCPRPPITYATVRAAAPPREPTLRQQIQLALQQSSPCHAASLAAASTAASDSPVSVVSVSAEPAAVAPASTVAAAVSPLSAVAAAVAPTSAAPAAAAGADVELPQEVLDAAGMVRDLGLPASMASPLLDTFRDYLVDIVQRMRVLDAADKWIGGPGDDNICIAAHSVKGAALQVGAKRLSTASRQLELLAKGGESDAAHVALGAWYRAADEAREALESTPSEQLLEGPVLAAPPVQPHATMTATAAAPAHTAAASMDVNQVLEAVSAAKAAMRASCEEQMQRLDEIASAARGPPCRRPS